MIMPIYDNAYKANESLILVNTERNIIKSFSHQSVLVETLLLYGKISNWEEKPCKGENMYSNGQLYLLFYLICLISSFIVYNFQTDHSIKIYNALGFRCCQPKAAMFVYYQDWKCYPCNKYKKFH